MEHLESRLCLTVFYDFDVIAQTGVGTAINGGGNVNFTSFGQGVSINDNGYVAFVGELDNSNGDSADNIYAFDPVAGGLNQLMNPVFMYPKDGVNNTEPGTASIAGELQVNNSNQVLARRRLNALVAVGGPLGVQSTAPLTYLETWDATQTSPPGGTPSALPAMGLPAGASAPLWFFINPATAGVFPSPLQLGSAFEAILTASTINNLGQVNMSAIVTGAGNNRVSTNLNGDLVGRGGIGSIVVSPMLGDNGYYVISTDDNRIFYERWDLAGGLIELAGANSGFISVSEAGISDDGEVIAFAGEHMTMGTGIFMSTFDSNAGSYFSPTKVAGIAGDGALDFGEFLQDMNSNGMVDVGEDFGGFLSGVDVNGHVAVNLDPSGGVGAYKILFEATSSNSDVGVYDLVVTTQNLVLGIGVAPKKVLAVGDSIAGVAGQITEIVLHDSVNNLGDVAFWIKSNTGNQAVVSGSDDTTDTDGDGLFDRWEIHGIDYDGDGTIDLDLPALGADPLRKDLFVEVDSMSALEPKPSASVPSGVPGSLLTGTALDGVIEAFYKSPATNPTLTMPTGGMKGINLHVRIDETNIPISLWGNIDNSKWPVERDALKSDRFGSPSERTHNNSDNILASKNLVFRYAMFAHSFERTDETGSLTRKTSGIAEFGGNDFVVTLGDWLGFGTVDQQAGTFMHELGHSLGLLHGGGDSLGYKPNYRSVMNYNWQTPYESTSNDVLVQAYKNGWKLDYSTGNLNTLDEASLNETSSGGIGGDTAVAVPVRAKNAAGMTSFKLVRMGGPADFNQNDSIDTSLIAKDLNNDEVLSQGGAALADHNDWTSIRYTFRSTSEFADGAHKSADANELTYSEFVLTTLLLNDIVPSQSADFDADNDTDGADFLAWQRGFGILAPNAAPADGDANGDQAVDAADLVVWQGQYGQITSPLVAAATQSEALIAPLANAPVATAELIDAAMAIELARGLLVVKTPPLDEEPTFAEIYADQDFNPVVISPAAIFSNEDEHPETNSSDVDETKIRWLTDKLLEQVFG